MNDGKFLALVRATIGIKEIQKKRLARRCKISRPYFSQILHEDVPLPHRVKDVLVSELNLASAMQRLMENKKV